MRALPMFPLGNVLMPGGLLSLHVFEPRFQALVRHCIDSDDHEFGVVLIDRGHEVGGGDVRRPVGTVARMMQVAELPDSRFAVIAVGVQRVRVVRWLPDDPYPIAEVDEWDDLDQPVAAQRVAQITQRTRRAAALAIELGDPASDPSVDVADEPRAASYQLAELAPVGAADAYDLLCASGPRTRLDALDALLADLETVQAFRLQSP